MKIFVEICVKLYWIVSDNLQFLVSPYILWRRTGHASQAIVVASPRAFTVWEKGDEHRATLFDFAYMYSVT